MAPERLYHEPAAPICLHAPEGHPLLQLRIAQVLVVRVERFAFCFCYKSRSAAALSTARIGGAAALPFPDDPGRAVEGGGWE